MSERGRIVIVCAAVAIVLGGAAFYFLGVHRPAQTRSAARAEIAAWEARWTRARECVIGRSQASADIYEALAIRELGADLANKSGCTKVVGDLTRGPGDATELDDVEVAWRAIDVAAGKVAIAYVAQLTPPDPARERTADPVPILAAALAEMDRAHAALRAAASLPPLPARTTATLPRGTLHSLAIDNVPLERLEWSSVTGGAFVARAATASTRAVVIHAPGKASIVMSQDVAVRSLPELDWGADSQPLALAIGPLDAAGNMAKASSTLAVPARPSPLFAVGNEASGAVAYAYEAKHAATDPSRYFQHLAVARIAGGKLVAGPMHVAQEFRYDFEPGGRGVLVWRDRDSIRGLVLGATPPPVNGTPPSAGPVELARGALARTDRTCLTATHAWFATFAAPSTRVVAFDTASSRAHELSGEHALAGCSRDAVLLRTRGTLRFTVCRDSCRTVELAAAHPSAVPVLVDDRVVVIAGARSVLGLWSEGQDVRYVALDDTFAPIAAVSDGTVIDVLGRSGSRLAIARVPAR